MVYQHVLILRKTNGLAGFFHIFHLGVLKLRTCDHQTFCVFYKICNSQKFQHTLQKNLKQLPWLHLLSQNLHTVFFLTDSIQVIHHLSPFFPGKINCLKTNGVLFMLSAPANTGRCFKLLSTNLHGHRAGLLPFPVIIADLGIVFSKINSYDQITNFVHIFSPLL